MIAFIRNHKIGVGSGAVAVLAALAWLAFGYFGVHTLFVDDVVAESGPVFDTPAVTGDVVAATTNEVEPEPTGDVDEVGDAGTDGDVATTVTSEPSTELEVPATSPPASPEVVTEFVGQFAGTSRYSTAGSATVLGNGTGQRFVRFENFETDNGPDLNVYLFDDATGDFVDLGDLKGNVGDQNYEIPTDVDLTRFDRVSIWCVRFGVGFGNAELMSA